MSNSNQNHHGGTGAKLWRGIAGSALLLLATACGGGGVDNLNAAPAESCMTCHNGSPQHDYLGPGIENPHPFAGADNLLCTTCHGGDPQAETPGAAHVPPPPEIGDRAFQDNNNLAYFNRLTLTGMDKYDDYEVDGVTYTALDYLQFVNPGDLRVVTQGKSCGGCHQSHAECSEKSLLATSAGVLSGALFAIGEPVKVPESDGLYENTASSMAFRAVTHIGFNAATAPLGAVGRMVEFPVYARRINGDPNSIRNNADYQAAALNDDINADGTVVPNSPLARLYHEQVAFTCGDCHLGSAGANNRTGDYRSSGCTACHMPYSMGGRAGTSDPNVNKVEPLDPDDIDDPERAHVRSHVIRSIAKTTQSGAQIQGIDDHTCAGCHQGSNRTVMQYWGIRLDQNEDVRRNRQYPANPVAYRDTRFDTKLFDPVLGNREFNGRDRDQYLEFEDYDGDGRDDTPMDVHHEAGMGCIDCHGSHDMHGGNVANAGSEPLLSRMEQAVSISCENCHGSVDQYASTVSGTLYDGTPANVGVDREGIPMRHVYQDASGNFWLKSRLDGAMHYLPQTRDFVVDTGKTDPGGDALYSPAASYAMGRADGNPATGIGPIQTNRANDGFSHTDNMDCASCHSAWTNTCMGCHLIGEFDNNFSNITGERIDFEEDDALFVYQSPVYFQLGVNSHNKITQTSANTKMFFSYEDQNNNLSRVFSFSDRNRKGGNTGTSAFPAMSHNAMFAHSIRGKVDSDDEGPRYCVACHITEDAIANYGTEYNAFRTALQTGDYGALNHNLLRDHIGKNPGNQLNSPFFVHQVAGLGSGLFTFDEFGAPVNRLDFFAGRPGAGNVAPANRYNPAFINLDLDRVVNEDGSTNASSNHALLDPGVGPNLRQGADDPNMAGPLGGPITRMMTQDLVLDSWYDADGAPQGNTSDHLD